MFRSLLIVMLFLALATPVNNVSLIIDSSEFSKPVVAVELLIDIPKVAVSLRNEVELIPEIAGAIGWDSYQMTCVALAIYHESRGLSDVSQFAVGSVVMNRSRLERYPSNPCEVVWQRYAFSWTQNKYNKKIPMEPEAWEKAQRIAYNVYSDPDAFDPTMGATHFHDVKVRPKWAKKGKNKTRIETHVFMRVES